MNCILEETKFILNKYHMKANKSLGQNFLINEEVIKTIVESSNIQKEDFVIEIGPGLRNTYKRPSRKCRKGDKCRIRQKND